MSTDFSTNCGLNFIQNTDHLITLENTSAKNKGLEHDYTIAYYNNIESRLLNHVFYINFAYIKQK